jgi:8-oxo-dGTP diphosphatase
MQSADDRRHKVIGDVHLLLTDQVGEVLFGQRRNTIFEDGAWHLPSGHLEAGESVIAALIREAEEEIGVIIDARDVEFSHVMHNSSSGGRVAFFFTVRRWEGEPENREPDKCGGLRWSPPDALPTRLIPYCRAALEHIAANRCFSAFGW